jgi:hypothetical protein
MHQNEISRPFSDYRTARPEFPSVFGRRCGDGLTLHIRDSIGTATGERDNLILAETGTCSLLFPVDGRWFALELPRPVLGSVFSRLC